MCVIGGDATQILPARVGSNTLDFLFINHPEPPQQTGGFDSQGKHLLTLVRVCCVCCLFCFILGLKELQLAEEESESGPFLAFI